ncbi:MAG: hypothetical protein ACRCXB_32160, partial [Aeromonadaceae bacterium]
FYAAGSGKALPKGTLMQVARKVFAWCMVDGKEMGDPSEFFAKKEMRADFHLALMEGLKLNFADVFIQLLGSLAGKAKVSELMGKMSGFMTSSQATQGEQR